MGEAHIELVKLTKSFSTQRVLDEVSLPVKKGHITAIIGKSGSGKSVLLKHIAGLMRPSSGSILFNGQDVTDMSPKQQRRSLAKLSFLFQNSALFDSMTVAENVALPLEEASDEKPDRIQARVHHVLEQLELDKEVWHKYPAQISGGMQKRVALARALIRDPEIVLFDEPTSGLDPIRRGSVFAMIGRYQSQFHFTALVVSHDIPDIFYLSDFVAILDQSKIQFYGTPLQLAQQKDPRIVEFLHGETTFMKELTGLQPSNSAEHLAKEIAATRPSYLICFYLKSLQSIRNQWGPVAQQYLIRSLSRSLPSLLQSKGLVQWKDEQLIGLLYQTNSEVIKKAIDSLRQKLSQQQYFTEAAGLRKEFGFSIQCKVIPCRPDQTLDDLMALVEQEEASDTLFP